MYTIIGGDGKEYGPVPADQVRAWIAAGRANMDTQVKELGTIEWRRLGDHPVFGPQPPPLGEPAHAAPAVPAAGLADRWYRLGAFCVNMMLYLLSVAPLMKTMLIAASSKESYSLTFSDMVDLANSQSISVGESLPCLILIATQVILLCTRGQTIGKLLFRIRIVRHETGETARLVHALLPRAFIFALVSLLPSLGIVYFVVDVCFIFRADRRCLHDLIAGTRVIDLRHPQGTD